MEFEGRIIRVLPARTGTRQDGTTWVDTNIIRSISQFLVKTKDAEGKEKVVYENDCAKMLVPHIPCRCGFSLRAKTVKKKDESGFVVIQENRCYKLEILGSQQQQQQPAPQSQSQQMPFPPQVDNFGYPIQPHNPEDDDLPF